MDMAITYRLCTLKAFTAPAAYHTHRHIETEQKGAFMSPSPRIKKREFKVMDDGGARRAGREAETAAVADGKIKLQEADDIKQIK